MTTPGAPPTDQPADELPLSTVNARLFVGFATALLFLAGLLIYWLIIRSDGQIDLLEVCSTVLFAILFAWISFSFSIASLGFIVSIAPLFRKPKPARQTRLNYAGAGQQRTAVLMPVYNESPESVFAGVKAMVDGLVGTGRSDEFDFFILSDSTRYEVWLKEEELWRKNCQHENDQGPLTQCRIFYRHRSKNTARKSGNIADFCEHWGDRYQFMIVLDADSLIEGETMTTMVDRISSDPRLGILQVPPVPVGRSSVFARIQQFASDVYGPVYARGFSTWADGDGNYFGHNAIIRVDAFKRFCHLPVLPGVAPLGGEILSHDFVEAALMLKNGYRVEVATDIEGSYEECPTTIRDFAQRDQRWCQGNMQHIAIMLSAGLKPFSRLHFLTGILSYVSAPLWIAFMFVTIAALVFGPNQSLAEDNTAELTAGLFVASMAMLLTPKLYGLLVTAIERKKRFGKSNLFSLTISVLLETFTSILMAPIFAIYHSTFVASVFTGKSVQWKAQQRDERGVSWSEAAGSFWKMTLIGVVTTLLVGWLTPDLVLWYGLFSAGLILSIPLAVAVASSSIGRKLKALKILSASSELRQPPIVGARDQWEAQIKSAVVDAPDALFERVITDEATMLSHCRMLYLTDNESPLSAETNACVEEVSASGDLSELPDAVRFQILTNPDALMALGEAFQKQRQ
jgi:membrane glycosyltransferase